MQNLSKLASTAILSTAMIAAPAMAQSNTAAPAQPVVETAQLNADPLTEMQLEQSLQTSDLNYAFSSTQDLQAQVMTEQEMVETEGAAIPIAVILASQYCTMNPILCSVAVEAGGFALIGLYNAWKSWRNN